MTIDYYQENAQNFYDGTVNVNMDELYDRFLKYIPDKSKILDVGCGSGRDTKAFLNKGYDVVAMDASSEMVERASQLTNTEVLHRTFLQVEEVNRYDAIWCCASLLHANRVELPQTMRCITNSLKYGGYWYLSFKYGESDRSKDGRHFTDMTEESLSLLINDFHDLHIEECWITNDLRPNISEKWLNAILRKSNL